MTRISVQLTVDERTALVQLAERKMVHPQQLARTILLNFMRRSEKNSKSATSEVSRTQQASAFAQ